MATFTPPQARGQWISTTTTTWQRPSIWNKPADPMSSPPRYAPAPAMPQTPPKAQAWQVFGSPTTSAMALPSPRVSPEVAPSVKHLTCYFWNAHGKCKHSDEECLYAHYYTGQIADPPVQVEPGRQSISYPLFDIDTNFQVLGPAVAGRNATTARPVYENWRAEHSNLGGGPNMTPALQAQMSNQVQNLHRVTGNQPLNMNYHAQSSSQRGQTPIAPNFPYSPGSHHQRRHSATSEVSNEQMLGTLSTIVENLYATIDKSHDAFAQAVVTLHGQCEDLLNHARTLHREANPQHKASIEKLVGAVTAIMPVIDHAKLMATETENATRDTVEKMERTGLGYMTRSWAAGPSDSSTTL